MRKRVILTFPPAVVHMPVTYRLAKDYNIASNILRAHVAPDEVGKLAVELSGDIDQIEAAVHWMRDQGIDVSLMGGEIVIDEALCVHCGLCTGVCPTAALTLQSETFLLQFRRSRCIVCEQCIPVCPTAAISTNL
ncbi:NIL domain-containing protein [Gloeobacter kilaueensis]|uniref:4Fe-4S ferredoxin iron-sulfur binding domain-containing protein n=1 Tax=Gloeobacter kilaueensis (strain ATCC BAA-2537 / CCAP 1431/1 / ULC 316 / JS1) TaxID=1183438 RepID=U5QMS9_GLOK1|nr:NIL domain-containing protein [Gloeobacter kilaueensis]AGY60226.1 4Fe-4S ferredoxin iron-sulfur binding domain-containing protein [Gloeobacter kilaueensis JS1]